MLMAYPLAIPAPGLAIVEATGEALDEGTLPSPTVPARGIFAICDDIERIESRPLPREERDRLEAPLLEELAEARARQDAKAERDRELAALLLRFPGGNVDVSKFSTATLEQATADTTIATHCPDCSRHLSGGDHGDAECSRCGLEQARCVMWDGLCIECQLAVDDAKLDGGRF